MPELPSGTVTFVFSDLEGSTRLLKELGDEGYVSMLGIHRALVREVFAAHGGSEIDTQGDAFFYSFSRARAAVAAAVELQRRHNEQEWPTGAQVRVRLGLHTGEPVVGEEGYTGLDVVRAARIAADGRGGQILLSEATRAIVGDDLPEGVDVRELGSRTLKDIDKPEPLYELLYGGPELGPQEPATPVPAPTAAQPDKPPKPPGSDFDPFSAFDPGQMIEQRVLAELEQEFRANGADLARFAPALRKLIPNMAIPKPPATPAAPLPTEKRKRGSVADELERLQELHEAGALSDEQYQRAVDRTVGEG